MTPVHRSKRRLQPEFGKIDAQTRDECIDPNGGDGRSSAKSMHQQGVAHPRMNEVNASGRWKRS